MSVGRRSVAFLVAFPAGLSILASAAPAEADLYVGWDCYLPSSGLDCSVLEGSLTSKVPFVQVVPRGRAPDVVVTLSSVPSENGTRYKLDFVGRPVDGYVTEVHTTDKIPSSIDVATANVRILTKLQRGLDDFMDQKVAAEMKDGKLSIDVSDPAVLPFTGRPEQTGVRWYFAPAVGAYVSDVQGVGVNASGTASALYNYSDTKWRAQQWIGTAYNRQSQPVPGTTETATIDFVGANANNVLARTISDDRRWSVGLLLAAEKNPQANYAMRANASVGVEYDLIPRQTVNQRNLGTRCAAGPELQRYDVTNTEGLSRQLVSRQFCDIYVAWHFAPVDVAATVGETTVLKSIDYRSFTAGLSAAWRITDNLTISPALSVQQVNLAINQAASTSTVYADPRQEIEASMLAAARQVYTSPFAISSSLVVRYFLGNGSLSTEDQRWKNTSNLR